MDCDYAKFQHLFPPETKIINFSGSAENYVANIRCKCKNKYDFCQNWLKQYEKIAGVALRLQLTRPRCGKTVVYKAAYRCERNTYPSSHRRVKSSYKHTDCRAIMRVTIKSSIKNRRVRSNDTLRGEYPTLITIEHNHNHKIKPAYAPETNSISKENETNDNPAIALQLQEEEVMEDCLDYFADSSLCPELETVYTFFDSDPPNIDLTTHHVEVITEPATEQADHEFEQELSWSSVQDGWELLFEKWQKENSVAQCNGLVKAATFLKNCRREASALECLAKKSGTAACKICTQSDSETRFSSHDHNYNKEIDAENKQSSYAL